MVRQRGSVTARSARTRGCRAIGRRKELLAGEAKSCVVAAVRNGFEMDIEQLELALGLLL
jgi:hypothetical protein